MMDIEQIRTLEPKHGAVYVLPEATSDEFAQQFAEALHVARPGIRALVVRGDIEQFDESQMNAAGWYRK